MYLGVVQYTRGPFFQSYSKLDYFRSGQFLKVNRWELLCRTYRTYALAVAQPTATKQPVAYVNDLVRHFTGMQKFCYSYCTHCERSLVHDSVFSRNVHARIWNRVSWAFRWKIHSGTVRPLDIVRSPNFQHMYRS